MRTLATTSLITYILENLDGFDEALAELDSFLVLGNEVVVTLWEGFLKTLVDKFASNDGLQFQETTEDDHVEDLGDAHFLSLLGSGDLVDVDVLAGGLVSDAVGVVDQQAAGLHSLLELVERLLVEHDSGVVLADDGRADALVANDDGHVCGTATLLGAVRGHPADFFIFHNARIGKDLTHGEHALATETGDDNFFCHDCNVLFFVCEL